MALEGNFYLQNCKKESLKRATCNIKTFSFSSFNSFKRQWMVESKTIMYCGVENISKSKTYDAQRTRMFTNT